MMSEWLAFIMFFVAGIILACGYPVAFSLAGSALLFAGIGIGLGTMDQALLFAYPSRLFGILRNETLIAIPLFVLMGMMLEKSQLAERLLSSMSLLFRRVPGGLAIAIIVVGTLLAASTGIIGATVVTLGLIALQPLLKRGYDPALASGVVLATGTLGQIIPPSIVLVLLGDVLSSAYQQAQITQGIFSPQVVSVGNLFAGALLPGLVLMLLYSSYVFIMACFKTGKVPILQGSIEGISKTQLVLDLIPPFALITVVLGSIIAGLATPSEAAAVGAMGATLLAYAHRQINKERLRLVVTGTLKTTCMIFFILMGASFFSLVFRALGGDEKVAQIFFHLPGGTFSAMLLLMVVIFLLGFILDFIEIIFVVIPIVAPIILTMGIDPVWLGIMIAVNLQASFLTPPFGFALFYLQGVVPAGVRATHLYRGVIPFIGIQIMVLILLALWPSLATWLPAVVF